MINEAVYTLYEGVGNVEAIDTAMRLGANHPMGPLELADFIGLDTCLSVMQVLYEGLADSKYRPCPLLVKYVEAGWLGRKTERGFYDYRGEKPVPTRLAIIAAFQDVGVRELCETDHHLIGYPWFRKGWTESDALGLIFPLDASLVVPRRGAGSVVWLPL